MKKFISTPVLLSLVKTMIAGDRRHNTRAMREAHIGHRTQSRI